MASESLVNLDQLLAPIAGENPAGESLPFEVRKNLDEYRTEEDPNDYDADDPRRPAEAKKADWPKIVRLAADTLADKSKDLLVAARLTEALTKLHSFTGLADGLSVVRGMVEQCWDRMYPDISDGDLEVRAAPINWLGDSVRKVEFPNTVRQAALFGPYSWQVWRQVQDGKGSVPREDFDKAVGATTYEECKARFDDLTRCVEELAKLKQEGTAKIGREAPALIDLSAAVGDCYSLAKQVMAQKAPVAAEEGEAAADGSGGEGGGGRVAGSRTEAYRRLAEAADLLERLEPHSPIPYLVRRAVELGSLPFPLLMKALIRDENVLSEMRRELGIKDETSY